MDVWGAGLGEENNRQDRYRAELGARKSRSKKKFALSFCC